MSVNIWYSNLLLYVLLYNTYFSDESTSDFSITQSLEGEVPPDYKQAEKFPVIGFSVSFSLSLSLSLLSLSLSGFHFCTVHH